MLNAMRQIFGFTDEEIGDGPLSEGRLLSLELEFSSRCNLRCRYCYSGKDMFRDNELELEEMYDVISQAKALGARKIVYLGAGEPLLDNKLRDVVNYVYKLGMGHILFTNATLINADTARFLYRHAVTVVVKHTSMRKEVYEHLCGVEGAYDDMIHGMNCLFEAGYPGKENHLGIEAVISSDNIDEVPAIWRWARTRGILPYFECLTYQGLAKSHGELYPSRERMQAVFEELAAIDLQEFGLRWSPHPPIAAFACKRHLYSCVVNSQGYVQPCVGVGIKVGSIRLEKLADILKNSPQIRELSRIHQNIKGQCKACASNFDCYGCRGTAYNLTGDYLASDPTCWRNAGKEVEIPTCLPAGRLAPPANSK